MSSAKVGASTRADDNATATEPYAGAVQNQDSQANPESGSSSNEVLLSIERVPVYTHNYPPPPLQASTSSATASIISSFERERVLEDITDEGVQIFRADKPSSVALTEDVRRLWAERGDFSKFSTQELLESIENKKKRRRLKRARLLRNRTSAAPSLNGVNGADESTDDDDDDDTTESTSSMDDEEDTHRAENAIADKDRDETGKHPIGGTIRESDFVKLRTEVLGKLDLAHFNSIHAHQLLGMLIKAHKAAPASHLGPGSGTGASGGRAGSPALSTSGQSNRSGSNVKSGAAGPFAAASLGVLGNLLPHALQGGGATHREEEFVLDPLSISLSKISLNSSVAARRRIHGDGDEGLYDDDEGSELDLDPNDPNYGLSQARKEIESLEVTKLERLRDFKILLQTKREAIQRASDLLRSGADELRATHSADMERWRGLIGLKSRGWGITPGRPLVDVERFGANSSSQQEDDEGSSPSTAARQNETADNIDDAKKGADEGNNKKGKKTKTKSSKAKKDSSGAAGGLQGFGTPILTSDGKIKEEGARDAWIGFGMPEAPIELRRRTIGYWADLTPNTVTNKENLGQSGSSASNVSDALSKLVFPDRPRRRLRVNFTLYPNSAPSDASERVVHWTSDRAQQEDEGRSGDSSPSGNVAKDLPMGLALDQDLQQASREANDELIFGDLVQQVRSLPPAFGVRLTPSSIRVILTNRLDLVVELVSTESSGDEEDKSDVRGSKDTNSRNTFHSPFNKLFLAFLRLGPLRRYNSFIRAVHEARKGDVVAKALAIRNSSMARPRKTGGGQTNSTASNSSANAAAVAGSKKLTNPATSGSSGIAQDSIHSLTRLESLGPILVTLHYWSFVYKLMDILKSFKDAVNENLGSSVGEEDGGLSIRVDFQPLIRTAVATGDDTDGTVEESFLKNLLTKTLEASRPGGMDRGEEGRGSEKTQSCSETRLFELFPSGLPQNQSGMQQPKVGDDATSATTSLFSGHSKIWLVQQQQQSKKPDASSTSDCTKSTRGSGRENWTLISSLSFSSPSVLSATFHKPPPSNVVGKGRKPIAPIVTNQPLQLDLDTLQILLMKHVDSFLL